MTDTRNYRVDFSKICDSLGFEPKFTVLNGLDELKKIFENGGIEDPNHKKYSNIQALMDKVSL